MKVLVKWSTFISCQDLATVAPVSHKLSQSCDESNCECKNVIPSRISSVNISQMIIIIFTINKRLVATGDWRPSIYISINLSWKEFTWYIYPWTVNASYTTELVVELATICRVNIGFQTSMVLTVYTLLGCCRTLVLDWSQIWYDGI